MKYFCSAFKTLNGQYCGSGCCRRKGKKRIKKMKEKNTKGDLTKRRPGRIRKKKRRKKEEVSRRNEVGKKLELVGGRVSDKRKRRKK
jgi:hypothetical protein